MQAWSIPYSDQDLGVWESLAERFGDQIQEVYFPVDRHVLSSGRSPQPSQKMDDFLQYASQPKTVLFNPILLDRPVEEVAPRALEALVLLLDKYKARSVVVANLDLARYVKETLPDFKVAASILMGITTPLQVSMIQEYLDVIVPDNRILRDLTSLRRLRKAFHGEIRLIVNDACLPGCPYRVQHFYEMGYGDWHPESLCQQILEAQPWLRVTGNWVLPRHLHHYDGLYDSLKLVGLVTLQDPDIYLRVLKAYIHREDILPQDIGGGPASVIDPIMISDEFFEAILSCDNNCNNCTFCKENYNKTKCELNANNHGSR
jgi:hypothetical protein